MKQLINIISIAIVILLLTSCEEFGAATPAYEDKSFIPGECIKGPELIFHEAYDASYNGSGVMRFFFYFDLDCKHESLSGSYSGRLIPSKTVFSSFGDDAGAVEKAYYDVYDNLQFLERVPITTIYYKDGMRLISHDKFAEYPKGSDLSQYLFFEETERPVFESVIPGLESTGDMRRLSRRFMVLLPCDVRSINMAGSYDFTFEIPVKVGQYLHYLKDSIDDPNAKVQFKDDVCTCNFTVTFIH